MPTYGIRITSCLDLSNHAEILHILQPPATILNWNIFEIRKLSAIVHWQREYTHVLIQESQTQRLVEEQCSGIELSNAEVRIGFLKITKIIKSKQNGSKRIQSVRLKIKNPSRALWANLLAKGHRLPGHIAQGGRHLFERFELLPTPPVFFKVSKNGGKSKNTKTNTEIVVLHYFAKKTLHSTLCPRCTFSLKTSFRWFYWPFSSSTIIHF